MKLFLLEEQQNSKVQQLPSEYFGGKKLNKSLNPDEEICFLVSNSTGNHSYWSGNQKTSELLLLDVAPLSLGIEATGGVMTKIIEEIQQFLLKNLKFLNLC